MTGKHGILSTTIIKMCLHNIDTMSTISYSQKSNYINRPDIQFQRPINVRIFISNSERKLFSSPKKDKKCSVALKKSN